MTDEQKEQMKLRASAVLSLLVVVKQFTLDILKLTLKVTPGECTPEEAYQMWEDARRKYDDDIDKALGFYLRMLTSWDDGFRGATEHDTNKKLARWSRNLYLRRKAERR